MIESREFGRMIITGFAREKDWILSREGARPGWRRREGRRPSLADIQESLD